MLRRRSLTGSDALVLPVGPRAGLTAERRSVLLWMPSAGLVVCAVAVAVGLLPRWLPMWASAGSARAAVALGLIAGAAVLHHRLARRRPAPHGWIVVDDAGVHRVERGRTAPLIDWTQPFGLTVLASADRATVLMALTRPGIARYLSARIRDAQDAAAAPTLVERAVTAADSDLAAGDDWALYPSDAEKLLSEIERRSPAALERAYLSDPSGEPFVLDRAELRVGGRRIDLGAPLEWRASYFQELGAHAASLFQATWVRQGEVEVVLVAPMPADGAWVIDSAAPAPALVVSPRARSSVARDLRLMQAAAGDPPPRELRRAIDRVFMLPVRRALDGAPRLSRLPPSASRPIPEAGRA